MGFSAATGDLADNHDILSVKVYQLESERKNEQIDPSLIVPNAETFSEPREHAHDEHPSKVRIKAKLQNIINFNYFQFKKGLDRFQMDLHNHIRYCINCTRCRCYLLGFK